MKIQLKGTSLFVDNIMLGMWSSTFSKLMLDSSLVLEHVFKQIEYKIDWTQDEVERWVKEEMNVDAWRVFKFKRGLL